MIKGSHHTPESRNKIRKARTGTKHKYETRVKIAKTSSRKKERLAGRYFSPSGHIECVYEGFSEYASPWKMPIDPCRKIVDKFVMAPEYVKRFEAWEASGHNPLLSPVLMRKVKKNGFTADNLKVEVKNSYSWWNEDSLLLKCLQAAMEKGQAEQKEKYKDKEDVIRNQLKTRKVFKNGSL